jgi:UDPglucose 6-dehydrogenase
MNELANLADRVGADVDLVRKGMGTDSRIGHSFLFPGIGYGGSCFPKDVDALGHTGKKNGLELLILEATNAVNRQQKRVLFEKVHARFQGDLAGKRFAIWGLAFKPKTDDVREAPALTVIELLLGAGASVKAHDPVAIETTRHVLGDKIEYTKKQYEALDGADALLICTEWNEFRRPDWDRMKAAMKRPIVFDGRNVFNPPSVEELGFEYYGIGRGRRLGNAGAR